MHRRIEIRQNPESKRYSVWACSKDEGERYIDGDLLKHDARERARQEASWNECFLVDTTVDIPTRTRTKLSIR